MGLGISSSLLKNMNLNNPREGVFFPSGQKKYSRIVLGVLAKDPKNRATYGTI
jgi:hypothetical protein